MNNKLREDLYNKMEKEYDDFVEKLKVFSPERIIDTSYEVVIKGEFLSLFYPYGSIYSIEAIEKLNEFEKPLEVLYIHWLRSDGGIHEVLEDYIASILAYFTRNRKDM